MRACDGGVCRGIDILGLYFTCKYSRPLKKYSKGPRNINFLSRETSYKCRLQNMHKILSLVENQWYKHCTFRMSKWLKMHYIGGLSNVHYVFAVMVKVKWCVLKCSFLKNTFSIVLFNYLSNRFEIKSSNCQRCLHTASFLN
jgi:hypothetical protein